MRSCTPGRKPAPSTSTSFPARRGCAASMRSGTWAAPSAPNRYRFRRFPVTLDAPRASSPINYALRLTGWSLALFGLFRLPWVGAHVFLPATQLQAVAGAALLGPSMLPIEATLACSGADALALCLGAIMAYPASRRMRAAGVAMATTGLLALNTLRIGTLGRAASSPRLFEALHVYVWPAVLT